MTPLTGESHKTSAASLVMAGKDGKEFKCFEVTYERAK